MTITQLSATSLALRQAQDEGVAVALCPFSASSGTVRLIGMSNSVCKARPMRDVGRGGDMTVHLPHGELVEGHYRQCRSADGLTMCASKRVDARAAPPHAEPVEARGSQFTLW